MLERRSHEQQSHERRVQARPAVGARIGALAVWLSCLALFAACAPRETAELPPVTVTEQEREVAGPVPNQPDPGALAELVAQAPAEVPQPTSPAGTLVGSDTGEPEPAAPVAALTQPSRPAPQIHAGEAELAPALSSPAIERAARAQLYWRLRVCRTASGAPPPPDSITLGFTIRQDGTVDPASVSATASDEALAEVALCVLRTFSASPFLGPPAGLDTSARVLITWPSVD